MSSDQSVVLSPGDKKRLNSGKKRKINVDKWKDKNRKKLRNSGQPYMSKKSKPVPGKLPPENVPQCRCKHDCRKLTLENMVCHFKEFYEMDYNGQNAFLAKACIKVVDIRRHTVSEAISKRHCSVEYYLPNKEFFVRVCRQTLCHTLKITPRRVQMLLEKIKFDRPLTDSRGTHGKQNTIPEEVRDLVREHIRSFPSQENHYLRRESQVKCLHPELNVAKMWKLFCIAHPDSGVKLHLYREIFNGEFKLRFGLPRSDTCATCDRFYVQLVDSRNETERKAIEVESKLHHCRADAAYKSLSEDTETAKINSSIVVLCVDLQQILFCPTLTHNNVFYQRQLSCYNLCIHNMGKNKACMFFWDETVAKRGSAEIASCLLKYIELYIPKLQPGEVRTLKFWSDRCIGQNNNWRHIGVMQHLVMNKYFTTVEQKFMTTGHSFLPCDRDFALIERAKKGKKVYVPFQWVELIANSNSKHPFSVIVMRTEDFRNTDIVLNSLSTTNFSITAHVWYQITADEPVTLRGRTAHNVLQPWKTHHLAKSIKEPSASKDKTAKKIVKRYPPVKVETFPRLYDGALGVKSAKKKDLMDMSKYLPIEHVPFYEELLEEQ